MSAGSMMDKVAETLLVIEHQNYTQPQDIRSYDIAIPTSHLSVFQGNGSGQANSLLQTSQPCLPAASMFTIDDALKKRVKQRAPDSRAETILERLRTQLIDTIELCKYLDITGRSTSGFLPWESELLILDDNA
jgi:hypothetical protein